MNIKNVKFLFFAHSQEKKKWNKLLGADHFEEEGMMMS
jgi:hypothetical protein